MRKITTLVILIVGTIVAGSALAAPKDVLPFIDDNYAQALAQARAKHVPMFVEAWAPW